jgi:RecB family endonuclease NucS
MDFELFKEAVEQTLACNGVLAAFMRCRVSYSGRAEAELDWGDRLVVIKGDNTLLIHQPINGNPINYLRPGSKIGFDEKTLLASNMDSKDSITVEIDKVYECIARRLEDGQKQILAGTEAEMSDHIRDNPHLISADFVPLSREEHTKYGFIDVFGHDGSGRLVIVECKRYAASLDAVTQLRRYVEKMMELKGVKEITGVIAAPKITPNAAKMLADWGYRFCVVEPPKRLEKHRKNQKRLGDF